MAGRTRKVVDISTGKIGKKEKASRKKQEENLKIDREELESGVPEWLGELAKEEYKRVVSEAGKIGLLDNLDLSMIAIYADNYERYIDASKNLQVYGSVIKGKFGAVPSPFLTVSKESAMQIMRCSSKLGLATTDRLRLIVPKETVDEVNKFLKYL